MAVNVGDSKSRALVDMFVRMRNDVIRSAILPGIEVEGVIKKLHVFRC